MRNTRSRPLWDARTPALSPMSAPPAQAPAPQRITVTAPDIRAEEVLFNLYLGEKARADYWHAQKNKVEAIFAAYKAKRLAKHIVKDITTGREANPSGKKLGKR